MILNIPGIGAMALFDYDLYSLNRGDPFRLWIPTGSAAQTANRGQYAALYTMAWSAAQTLGPVSGAQVAQHAGFNILWWILGGLCIVTSVFFTDSASKFLYALKQPIPTSSVCLLNTEQWANPYFLRKCFSWRDFILFYSPALHSALCKRTGACYPAETW